MSVLPVGMGSSGGYEISRSVRLRSSASAYFNRTPASASNRNTWTWSAWVKRGTLGSGQTVFAAYPSSTVYAYIGFTSSDQIRYASTNSGASLTTTAVYRDPSAWYHIVFVYDDTQATSSNRLKLYVNGVQVTAFGTAAYPTLNFGDYINSANVHNLGRFPSGTEYTDGYLTEVNFIDGQALTPSSFGETDVITGVWKPKKYAGTYGTNGFYLNFSDNSAATAAAIGKDYSGNGNNWTPNNISVTAGSTYDSMLDTPTPYADGGNGRGNYCTLNPVFKNANTTYGVMATPIDGNLNTVSMGAGTNVYGSVDLFGNKGKWYAECRASSIASQVSIGFLSDDGNLNRGAWINSSSGVLVDNVSKGTGGFASGNTIGIAYNSINNTVQFYVNNSAVGSAYTTSTGAFSNYFFWAYTNSGVSLEWNFGQRPFAYTPPTGFKALNTQNLPDATIKKGNQYFDVSTWTGDGGSTKTISGLNFQPDLVWTKQRSIAQSHEIWDSVRGTGKSLESNSTAAEYTGTTYGQLSSFNADGFTGSKGTDPTYSFLNANGGTYVGWQWKESVTAGFDIVTYTGDSTTNRQISHGLGVAPSMMIIKNRDFAWDWIAYHKSVGATGYLSLNQTAATTTSINPFNNTAPTSSVFTVAGNSGNTYVNYTGAKYVAYLFAEVAGFSKFGSYTGNGSADGPFVFTGMRSRFIMIKRTDTTSAWLIVDTARQTYNVLGPYVVANASDAETTGTTVLDVLSNGFKMRSSTTLNSSGGTYVFAAFAENPFKNSLAR